MRPSGSDMAILGTIENAAAGNPAIDQGCGQRNQGRDIVDLRRGAGDVCGLIKIGSLAVHLPARRASVNGSGEKSLGVVKSIPCILGHVACPFLNEDSGGSTTP